MKKLLAKTGTYIKDGAEKGEYTKIGVLMQGNEGGEYMLIDPTVNLAGVLVKQNILAAKQGKEQRDTVMVSVFVEDQQGQQQGYQQQPQQQQQQYQQPQQLQQQQPSGMQANYQQPQQNFQQVTQDDNIAF